MGTSFPPISHSPVSPAVSPLDQKQLDQKQLDQKQRTAALQQQVQRVERGRLAVATEIFSSGFAELDELLPAGGLVVGELVEWLADEGAGAGTLGLWAAWQALQQGGVVVVIDRQRKFYPPSAAALGISLDKLIVVQPGSRSDELWALDQALRCRAVAAVWAPLEQISQHDFRRLQLAAEQGQTAGMFIRSRQWLQQPSWAHLQLLLQPHTAPLSQARERASPLKETIEKPLAINPVSHRRAWRIQITRCRGLAKTAAVDVHWG